LSQLVGNPRSQLFAASLLRRQTHKPGSRCQMPKQKHTTNASHGVHSKIAPPSTRTPSVHSKTNRSPPLGKGLPRPSHVPSLSFHPTPTVYSARCSADLLHPAADHEVRHVSKSRPKTRTYPQWRRPFEAFPSLVAAACLHTTYPHVVAQTRSPCCHGSPIVTQPQGFKQVKESVASRLCFHTPPLDAPMGLKPNPHATCTR
jgi:hypothetical protein